MNANFIVRYGSIGLYYKTAMSAYGKRMQAIIRDIKDRKTNEIEAYSERVEKIYLVSIRKVHETDKGYDTCALGAYDKKAVGKALGMDDERYVPVMLLTIGKAVQNGNPQYRLPVSDVAKFIG